VSPDLATLVAAFEQCWRGVVSACTNLTPEQWDRPTDLPGWSVKDNVSHIVGEEALLLGEPLPEHELPEGLAHIKHEFAREIEVPVDVRRSRPGDAVLAELRDVAARRLAVLRSYDESDLDREVDFAGRMRPLRNMLGIRAFDCWTHEQDIRRALGHPGGIPSPGASIALDRLLMSLPGVIEDVPALAGRTFVVETTGPIASVSTLSFGGDGSYADGDAATADARITADALTFLRIGTGRDRYDAVAAEVTLTGDEALAAEFLRHAAVTP
jgi:uncharacterized protein (TIGR03083 family)